VSESVRAPCVGPVVTVSEQKDFRRSRKTVRIHGKTGWIMEDEAIEKTPQTLLLPCAQVVQHVYVLTCVGGRHVY